MAKTLLDTVILTAIKNKELDAVVVKQMLENEILEALMKGYRYNQSKAAKAYGKSRGSFRVLLKERFGDEYVGSKG
jgi:DNA-binding protein Fis